MKGIALFYEKTGSGSINEFTLRVVSQIRLKNFDSAEVDKNFPAFGSEFCKSLY